MKLLILVALLAAGLFVYPIKAENNGDSCGALAAKVGKTLAVQAQDLAKLDSRLSADKIRAAGGAIVETAMRQHFPLLPPALACTAMYWKLTLDPKGAAALVAGSVKLPAL